MKTEKEPHYLPRLTDLINVSVFCILILIGGITTIVLPKKEISEAEKRKLTPLPRFSTHSFFFGGLTDSLDKYVSDNFAMRDNWIDLATVFRNNRGYKNQEIAIINVEQKNGDNSTAASNLEAVLPDSLLTDTTALDAALDTLTDDFQYVKSVFIHNGRAFQLFGGSSVAVKAYANQVNQYQLKLGDSVQIYCLAIPTLVDFYLPAKYAKKSNKEKPNIEAFYAALNPGIKGVPAYEELSQHTDEYLYFNTDHHWNGRGAYYAYAAFCKTAGLQAVPIDKLDHKFIPRFRGSLYELTRSEALRNNPDSVEYFKIPGAPKLVYYQSYPYKKPIKGQLLNERAKGGNAYGVFIGGDVPLIKITTQHTNGKKIAIVKDSYGNALIPFLALHYSEIYVVDYRYFQGSLPNLIKENKITELVFAHNTFVLNNRYAIVRERAMLKGVVQLPVADTTKTKPLNPIPSVPKDTLKK